MVFKINVSYKGITRKYETNNEEFIGLNIGDKIKGEIISDELENYELEITGTSDKAGFPGLAEIPGPFLKKPILKKGKGMKENLEGLRKRKTVRGKEISQDTVQINTKVIKEGKKAPAEIFKKEEKQNSK
ncbi:MAG: S6e family ribosomal protein [Candidatus Pacearchaeota archaeon]